MKIEWNKIDVTVVLECFICCVAVTTILCSFVACDVLETKFLTEHGYDVPRAANNGIIKAPVKDKPTAVEASK